MLNKMIKISNKKSLISGTQSCFWEPVLHFFNRSTCHFMLPPISYQLSNSWTWVPSLGYEGWSKTREIWRQSSQADMLFIVGTSMKSYHLHKKSPVLSEPWFLISELVFSWSWMVGNRWDIHSRRYPRIVHFQKAFSAWDVCTHFLYLHLLSCPHILPDALNMLLGNSLLNLGGLSLLWLPSFSVWVVEALDPGCSV